MNSCTCPFFTSRSSTTRVSTSSNHWNALTDGRVKYVFHARDGEEQLFDLDRDPGELHDLAPEAAHAATLRLWRARMIEHLAERGDAWVRNGRLQPRPASMPLSPHYPKAAG